MSATIHGETRVRSLGKTRVRSSATIHGETRVRSLGEARGRWRREVVSERGRKKAMNVRQTQSGSAQSGSASVVALAALPRTSVSHLPSSPPPPSLVCLGLPRVHRHLPPRRRSHSRALSLDRSRSRRHHASLNTQDTPTDFSHPTVCLGFPKVRRPLLAVSLTLLIFVSPSRLASAGRVGRPALNAARTVNTHADFPHLTACLGLPWVRPPLLVFVSPFCLASAGRVGRPTLNAARAVNTRADFSLPTACLGFPWARRPLLAVSHTLLVFVFVFVSPPCLASAGHVGRRTDRQRRLLTSHCVPGASPGAPSSSRRLSPSPRPCCTRRTALYDLWTRYRRPHGLLTLHCVPGASPCALSSLTRPLAPSLARSLMLSPPLSTCLAEHAGPLSSLGKRNMLCPGRILRAGYGPPRSRHLSPPAPSSPPPTPSAHAGQTSSFVDGSSTIPW